MFKRLSTELALIYAALFGAVLLMIAGAVYLAVEGNPRQAVRAEMSASSAVFDRLVRESSAPTSPRKPPACSPATSASAKRRHGRPGKLSSRRSTTCSRAPASTPCSSSTPTARSLPAAVSRPPPTLYFSGPFAPTWTRPAS